ncbi:MAG: BREX-6 system BrxE protein [Leptospiraceae bacterium]|nr:BREX-6 system BrxE protein [Leptospiraceae bacterium]
MFIMKVSEPKYHHVFEKVHVDLVLECQILVGRLGEIENFDWWGGIDATDSAGGADFFQKLFPKEANYPGFMAAGEAVLSAAKKYESKILMEAGKYQYSIFLLPFSYESLVMDRWAHLKNNPGELSEKLKKVLSPDFKKEEMILLFQEILKGTKKPESEGSTFGTKAKLTKKEISYGIIPLMSLINLEKGKWGLPYCV